MGDLSVPRIEIDGRVATVESLWAAVGSGYGHFTAMQVRDREVRGVDMHLARLNEGTRALFGADLDGGRIRELIRHALGDDTSDASVGVNVFSSEPGNELSVMATVREPASMPSTPRSLQTVSYQRPLAHIKHVGGFGQAYYARLAAANGFDEALLVGPDGVVAEGSITNMGFHRVGRGRLARRARSARDLDAGARTGARQGRRALASGNGACRRPRIVRRSLHHQFPGARPRRTDRPDHLPADTELVSIVMRMFDAAPWDPI